MDVLGKVKDLRGINFGVSETRFEAVWEKLGGKTVVMPHCELTLEIVRKFKDTKEWVTHVLQTKTHNRGLCLMVYPPEARGLNEMSSNLSKDSSSATSPWGLMKFGWDVRRLIKQYA